MRDQAEAVSQGRYKPRISMLLPDLGGGGAERASVNMANNLIGRGYRVEIALLAAQGVFLGELHPKVQVFDLGVGRFRSLLPKLVSYLRTSKPDVLIANMWPLTGVAVLARYLAFSRVKVVLVEHINWSASHHSNSMSTKLGMRLLFPLATSVVAVSQGVADDLAVFAKVDRVKIKVIYNAIVGGDRALVGDTDLHCAGWLVGQHKKVIAIGSFKEQKNFPLLIKAFAVAVASIDSRLLIMGEGPGRQVLETLIKDHGLQDKVFLPGFSTCPDSYLARSDLFVLSSDFEGFGNVIVEALHAGVPVVSTRCPSGPDEILEGGRFGELVPVGDSDALASAIVRNLKREHDSVELKERAAFFSVDRSVDAYLSLLDGQ